MTEGCVRIRIVRVLSLNHICRSIERDYWGTDLRGFSLSDEDDEWVGPWVLSSSFSRGSRQVEAVPWSPVVSDVFRTGDRGKTFIYTL